MNPAVLIVEDEADLVYGLRQALQASGYTARTAMTGPEALSALQVTQPEAIILDMNLPGLSGVELLQRVRGLAPRAKILIVTGHVQEYGSLLVRWEVSEVFSKPVSVETLLSSLNRLLLS